MCIELCESLSYIYAAVQNGTECFCGNVYQFSRAQDMDCKIDCIGNIYQKCGGLWMNSVYQTKINTSINKTLT